jgi:serine/threonine protein kinase
MSNPAESRTFPRGSRFGPDERFEVLSELGSGSTAVVLLVRDAKCDRKAAAKLIRCRDGEQLDDVLERANAETRTLARLNHENVVQAYEAGLCQESAYVLLEYQEGIALDQFLERGPLSVGGAIEVAIQIARGIEHAHAAGVLHLDLKPSNVWLSRNGCVKLLDFGIDGELDHELLNEESTTSFICGTPAYMAPEQWRLLRPDARADVWALGVILYELLTGNMPFAKSGSHPVLICEAVVSAKTPPAISNRLNAPPALDQVLRRALACDRKERFQCATDLRDALEAMTGPARSPESQRRTCWVRPTRAGFAQRHCGRSAWVA